MGLPGPAGLRQFHRLANWSDFSLFYLESRFPRLFFYLPTQAPVHCPERIVEINPFLRIRLRELGYGIILQT